MVRFRCMIPMFVAALLAWAGAPHLARGGPAGAAPATSEASACKRSAFRVVVDVGHSLEAPGARSSRGISEFVFNLFLAERIHEQLIGAGFGRTVLLITDGPARQSLFQRVARANSLAADLFLSIHHDSVPDMFLKKWEFEEEPRSFSDRFKGHSIFISNDNSDRAGSLAFAGLLGQELKARGLEYTPHYTEKFMGNRRRLLVDADAGVYRYDQLIVLKHTNMPAVLLESGSIINREEELRMGSAEHHELVSAAVADAVESFCASRRPRGPTAPAVRPVPAAKPAASPAAAALPAKPVKQR
jgi:N-acetylmuramoyl-L-alanine amidase